MVLVQNLTWLYETMSFFKKSRRSHWRCSIKKLLWTHSLKEIRERLLRKLKLLLTLPVGLHKVLISWGLFCLLSRQSFFLGTNYICRRYKHVSFTHTHTHTHKKKSEWKIILCKHKSVFTWDPVLKFVLLWQKICLHYFSLRAKWNEILLRGWLEWNGS